MKISKKQSSISSGRFREEKALKTLRSGKTVDLFGLEPNDVELADIGASLAKQCRYDGHCIGYYSVAEHSVLVSRMVPDHLSAYGLMHDAAEAYIGDMCGTLKHYMYEYIALENYIHGVIMDAFGMKHEIPDEVHEADKRALRIEMEALFHPVMPNKAVRKMIRGYSPYDAERIFYERARELKIV